MVCSSPAAWSAGAGDVAKTVMPLGQKTETGVRSLQPEEIQTRCSPKQSKPAEECESHALSCFSL